MTDSRLAVILHGDVVGSTALVRQDERLAHDRIQDAFRRLAAITGEHGGQTHEIRGDALVAEFARPSEAVMAAIAFQRANRQVNEGLADEIRPEMRIGISLGEIVFAHGTLTGSGVVLAQRVEQLAEANGICITSAIHEATPRRLPVDYASLGDRQLKGFDEPVRVYRLIDRDSPVGGGVRPAQAAAQRIQFTTTGDGVRLAYAQIGEGDPPIVKAGNWLTHLEYDWESPVWRHLYREMSRDNRLVRYDGRGNGLSDWRVDDISFEAFVRDLEAVADAVIPGRFVLLGISQGCAVAVAYAARHPERVTHLILYGGYVKGYLHGQRAMQERWEALATLIKQGWGQNNPAFNQIFTSFFLPGATAEQMHWFTEMQRISTSAENAVRNRDVVAQLDVEPLLSQVSVPTLVLHARGDVAVPLRAGREFAMRIPGARFVPLEGQNHLLIETEPAWPRFLSEVRSFLAEA